MILIQLNEEKIIECIENASKGIHIYVTLMDSIQNTNITQNYLFQKKYNHFYRVRQRNELWYKTYYDFMESRKQSAPSFEETLNYFYETLHRYEPSFSSKLVATLDSSKPLWDKYVLTNLSLKAPAYHVKYKIEKSIEIYSQIENWYYEYLRSLDGKKIIEIFNSKVSCANKISDVKKIDFILWQLRAPLTI